MSKEYTCLGMMSGTSGDGVDASIIQSDGLDKFTILKEKYYQYDENLFREYHDLKKKINSSNDLKKNSSLPLSEERNDLVTSFGKGKPSLHFPIDRFIY